MKLPLIIGLIGLAVYNDRQIRKDPPIYYVDDLPGGFNALTIPPIGIYIVNEAAGNVLLKEHELYHWAQYQRDGLLPFWNNYLCGSFLYGYDGNPYEVEARHNECEFCKFNYTLCVQNGWANTVYNPDFRL